MTGGHVGFLSGPEEDWVPQPFAEVKLQIGIDYTNCDLESSIFNVSTSTKALF